MKRRRELSTWIWIIQLSLIFFSSGCKTPPAPSEVREAQSQEQALWGAGVSIYAPDEFQKYELDLAEARKSLKREELKIGIFRNYDLIRDKFTRVLKEGEQIDLLIKNKKAALWKELDSHRQPLYSKYETLNSLSLELNQRRFSRRYLAQADILFKEINRLVADARYDEAMDRLETVSSLLNRAESILREQLKRYMDQSEIAQWRKMAQRAVEQSRVSGKTVIVISKLEKTLTVYQAGQPVKTCEVGLGFNGLNDKLHAGDDATPEGDYQIKEKINAGKYGKGLMINYPNEEDLKKFSEAKRRGYITPATRIGGLIEIHGGGKDGLTKGCIALDDREMDELFGMISTGTQVTIVGTTDRNNKLIGILKRE
ncbi:MAG: L,D-transpeptidase [Acidobacteriota bacterium]|nr:L,D-transpeptidase [Acidobacteriota bacterium]